MPESLKLAAAALLAASGMFAQSAAARPTFNAFEVAAIKPTPDDQTGRFIRMEGAHQFAARGHTLKSLLGAAYNLPPRAISGGSSWIDSERYDIIAKTPNEIRPNLDEQMAMLRKLLVERFKLAFHREEKEFPVYALTIAKGGPKLKESTAPGDPAVLINHIFPDHIELPARNATMAQFVAMMQRAVLDRPVIDRTGLSAKYDFDLEWTPDDTQFGVTLPAATQENPQRPGLSAALPQQLGLKLVATKGPVAVLVIDHVERPAEN